MKINILFASLSVVALCASCSTGKSSGTEEEQVAEQTTQTEEESQVVSQKLDEVAEVEKKAPEERTLRDDLVIVCHAPEKVSEEMEQDERVVAISTYISNNIYTPEAIQFFQEMSAMGIEQRQAYFDTKVTDLKIQSCPMSAFINPESTQVVNEEGLEESVSEEPVEEASDVQ